MIYAKMEKKKPPEKLLNSSKFKGHITPAKINQSH
jgi:hypothetical protein